MLIYRAAFLSALATSFVGGLTAGLGQGFDLGTAWPGPVGLLVLKALEGSLEPVHRFLTVATGLLYGAALAQSLRSGWGRAVAALAAALLAGVALTGRAVLLALGGEVPEPWAHLVYPLNNALALGATAAMALLASGVGRLPSREDVLGWPGPTVLFRGAAFWGFVASVSGAYMLGYSKLEGRHFPYSLPPALDQLPWLIHLAAGGLAVALGALALMKVRPRGAWAAAFAVSVAAQPVVGLALYLGASASAWAPGPQVGLHLAFAHLLVISGLVLHLRRDSAAGMHRQAVDSRRAAASP